MSVNSRILIQRAFSGDFPQPFLTSNTWMVNMNGLLCDHVLAGSFSDRWDRRDIGNTTYFAGSL